MASPRRWRGSRCGSLARASWPGTLWGGPWGSELKGVVCGEGPGLKDRGHGRVVWGLGCLLRGVTPSSLSVLSLSVGLGSRSGTQETVEEAVAATGLETCTP